MSNIDALEEARGGGKAGGALAARKSEAGRDAAGKATVAGIRGRRGEAGAGAAERLAASGPAPERGAARVHHGDCESVIRGGWIAGKSVNLIITSPPYADQRKRNYGGIPPGEYVDWFLPKAEQFRKVLAADGSFVLNIKEKAVKGERHTYVLDLILALREQGWLWVEEYCWHKKNCYPGKWPNRFRDAWERCLHFTLDRRFKMRQNSVMVPVGDWARTRLGKLSGTDRLRDESRNENGFGKKVENWLGRDSAYPTNVLHMATECGYKRHPATFPVALPRWFILLFTDPGDTVLDPFAGSGTALVAARDLRRKAIGIDSERAYCDLMSERLRE